MGPESGDRQSQADFCEICDAIDVLGSVALNARQPPQSTATGSARQIGSASLERRATSSSATAGTTSNDPQEVKSSAGADGTVQEQAEKNVEKPSELETCGAEGTSEASKQGNKCVSSVVSSSATPVPACEVATLQQLLQAKSSHVALVSDVDEQLLLNISFKQPVRLTSFSILASTPPADFSSNVDEDDSVSGPMLVKVYCNKSSLNFCGVADEACAFSVMLNPDDVLRERRIALPGSRFQMCSSVQLFIQENLAGSTYTFINKLALFGVVHKRYS